jgi:hypothetical protein
VTGAGHVIVGAPDVVPPDGCVGLLHADSDTQIATIGSTQR